MIQAISAMPQPQQKKSAQLKQLPTNDHIDKLLWIKLSRRSRAVGLSRAWTRMGEFVYAFNGVMEVNINRDLTTLPRHLMAFGFHPM